MIQAMMHIKPYDCKDLDEFQLASVRGGIGPIGEAVEWYYKTMGSFYRGLWDGLTGKEPAV